MSEIKLLFVLVNLSGGGTERMYVNLCNNLDRAKFKPVLCLLKAEGEYLPLIRDDVKIIDLNTDRVRNSLFKISNTIKTEKPDIVMSSISHLNIFLATFKFMLPKYGVKYIARESNILSSITDTEKFIVKRLRKKYDKFDHIVAQSKDMKDDLIANFSIQEKKITVINNFVDELYIEKKLQEDISVTFPENKINILSIGRLEYQKGYDLLLESFSKFRNNEHIHLTIIGQGSLKEKLQTQITLLKLDNKVSLQEFTPNPYKYMEQADILISPSRFEGFPNIVIESLICGLPVIANNYKGGINEILQYSEFGCIIDIQNASDFENTIPIVLNKDRKIIKNKAIELYSKEKTVKQYERLFITIYSQNKNQ